jgi:flagellar export protein FliJ
MNLAALRQYRRRLEDMLRAELSVLERALETSIAHSRAVEQAVVRAGEEFQIALCRGLSGDEMIDRTQGIANVTVAARHAASMVTEATVRWEQKRADVLEAARARKTLEVLEERRQQQRMIRLRRLEQQSLDETAHIRFLRSVRDGGRHVS